MLTRGQLGGIVVPNGDMRDANWRELKHAFGEHSMFQNGGELLRQNPKAARSIGAAYRSLWASRMASVLPGRPGIDGTLKLHTGRRSRSACDQNGGRLGIPFWRTIVIAWKEAHAGVSYPRARAVR